MDVLTGDLFNPRKKEDGKKNDSSGSELISFSDGVYDERDSVNIRHIMQPRTVTYSCYRFSKIQRAILVHIREELTFYISKNLDDISANELITIPLFVEHYPSMRRSGLELYETVSKMMPNSNNFIYFEWKFDPEKHKELFMWMQRGVKGGARLAMPKSETVIQETSAILVNAKRCLNDPGKVIVSINPHVIPFLLYYGAGVGGTVFDRDLSLKLNSSYSSRLYEMILDWSSNASSKVISLEELRKLLVIPKKFQANDIRERVLNVAKQELEEVGCPVTFEYKMEYSIDYGYVTGSRGQYPANCVVFEFNKKESSVDMKELGRKQILICLREIADKECVPLCDALAKQIVENHQDGKIISKFDFYYKKVNAKQMTGLEFKNTMLKIVREVTGVDLRSGYHIRNAARVERRRSKNSGDDVKSVGSLF